MKLNRALLDDIAAANRSGAGVSRDDVATLIDGAFHLLDQRNEALAEVERLSVPRVATCPNCCGSFIVRPPKGGGRWNPN